jgi:transcriptional regulator with XRE-family HTH domain
MTPYKISRLNNTKLKNICGQQIRTIRRQQQRTLVDLSAELDIGFGLKLDRSTLGKIENGVRQVTDIELLAIAAALQVEIEALLPLSKRKLLKEALQQKDR